VGFRGEVSGKVSEQNRRPYITEDVGGRKKVGGGRLFKEPAVRCGANRVEVLRIRKGVPGSGKPQEVLKGAFKRSEPDTHYKRFST